MCPQTCIVYTPFFLSPQHWFIPQCCSILKSDWSAGIYPFSITTAQTVNPILIPWCFYSNYLETWWTQIWKNSVELMVKFSVKRHLFRHRIFLKIVQFPVSPYHHRLHFFLSLIWYIIYTIIFLYHLFIKVWGKW